MYEINEKHNISQYYSQTSIKLVWFPLAVIFLVIVYLLVNNAFSPNDYAEHQRDWFLPLNSILSQFSDFQHNITQIGNALVFLSSVSFLLVYYPKIWEAILSASLISLLISRGFKSLLDVPRPLTYYGEDVFTVIGEPAVGFSSTPSGHSITIFTTLTVLMLSFLPPIFSSNKALIRRVLQYILISCLGFFIALSRVAVGAHHPLDVVLGCAIGFLCGVAGILITKKYNIWGWIANPKYYPILIVLLVVLFILLIIKVLEENIPIYYLPIFSLIFTIYALSKKYIQHSK